MGQSGSAVVAQTLAAAAVGFGAAMFLMTPHAPGEALATLAGPQLLAGCNIKGNVSTTTGKRIYHVPGQTYYNQTIIEPASGERWFCSEREAQAAGWRRSKL